MCFPAWSLILCFLAGALLMLAFWLTLARIGMRDFHRRGKKRLSLGNRDNGGGAPYGS